jgi:OmpR family response regulator NblR
MFTYQNNLDSNLCVLLVKTDEKFTQQASIDLRSAGYTTVVVNELTEGLRQLEKIKPAMIVLDYGVTKQKGAKFCRQVRNENPDLYILLVIDSANVDERIICLDVGADDYFKKPYKSKEFLQLLYFYLKPKPKIADQLHFGELVLELNNRCLVSKKGKIDLTTKEFELLKFFMSHPEEILTREQILENVWGYNFHGESNVIEVYIRYLRRKLEKEGHKRLLQTVRGLGYVLRQC